MSQPTRGNLQADNDWSMAAVGLFITLMVTALFFRQLVIECITTLLYWLWSLADFSRFHVHAAWRINLLAETHNKAEAVTWSEFFSVMDLTAGILLIALIPLVITGVIAVRRHQVSRTRRDITIHSLPRIMSSFSSAIIPALNYGDKKTQLMNVDPDEHRSAQTPDEFAIQHKLVVNGSLRRDLAESLFVAQLGKPLAHKRDDNEADCGTASAFDQFNDHERAMFAIFGLQYFLDKRNDAEHLLDELNRSTLKVDHVYRNKIGYPNLSLAAKAFLQVTRCPAAKAWVTHYSYVRTAIAALHDNDLHLPIRRYRWLKGLDRTLWYALASTGRPWPFVEGVGVVSQSQWEKLAARYHIQLSHPVMTLALDGLEADLRNIGAVMDISPPNSRSSEYACEDNEEPPACAQHIHRHHPTHRPRMR